jgi:hypothetical protein
LPSNFPRVAAVLSAEITYEFIGTYTVISPLQ